MADLGKAMAEQAEDGEMPPLPQPGEVGRGRKRDKQVISKGPTSDYLARRLAPDHPDLLQRLKAGECVPLFPLSPRPQAHHGTISPCPRLPIATLKKRALLGAALRGAPSWCTSTLPRLYVDLRKGSCTQI
jgi:hypothetical protein